MNEEKLQINIAAYLRMQYPDVIFHSDYGSGAKLTMGQAIKQKRLNGGERSWPDLFIAEPVGKYNGMFIELKRDGVKLHKKNMDWYNDHFAEQANMLSKLNRCGYASCFAVGFGKAKLAIDNYLKYGKAPEMEQQ